MSRGVFALVPALVVGALSLTTPAQDVIVKRDGSQLPPDGGRPLEVKSETVKDVTYQLQGIPAPLRIPSSQIRTVRYAKQPPEFRDAENAFAQGDYETAIPLYEGSLTRKARYKWLEQYARFRIGQSLANVGDNPGAAKAFRELLDAVPNTRFLAPAWLGILRAEAAGGKKNDAAFKKAAKSFESAIQKHDLGKSWAFEIDYLELLMMQARGESGVTDAARTLTNRAKDDNPSVAKRAQILVGLSLLDSGDLKEAKAFFSDVLKDATQEQYGVRASAYAGLGECIFKGGSDKQTSHLPKARDLFLRSIVIADKHPEEVDRAVVGRSLFYAGRCFALLKRDENEKANNPTRHARRLFQEVEKRFPGTELAKRALEERRKL